MSPKKRNYCILSDSVTLQSEKFRQIKTIHEDLDFVFLSKPPGMANTGLILLFAVFFFVNISSNVVGDAAGTNFFDYVVQKYGGIRYKPKILISLDKIQGKNYWLISVRNFN